MQPRQLRCRQVRALLAAAAAATPHVAQAAAQEVTYQVEFEGNWTTSSTPGGVVGGAHFTTLIGAVHSGDVTFWSSGSMASAGVEDVAELGAVATFRSEVRASPHTRSVIQEGVSGGGRGRSTFTIALTPSHPRVTLLSMIGPSPDWFVGVSGVSLLDDSDSWRDVHVLDLYPYDAGTEDGTEFTLSNPPTSPQGVIRSIRGRGKFSNVRMARLTFTRQRSDPEASFASASSSTAEDAGTRDVTVNLSPGPDAELTLRYTLSGTATGGSDYTIAGVTGSSGTVTVSSGQTDVSVPVAITDDNAEEGAETVVLTLTAGDGYTVGSPAAHTLTITDNDPTGPPRIPSVSLSASPNPVAEGRSVTVTAQLSEALETDVTIPLTLTPGTAEPADYGALPSITLTAGATRGTGTVITAEDDDEDDETFTVALGTLPPAVMEGIPSSVTVTIADDDGPGPTGNRPPLVVVSCAPCEVEPGGEVRLTAEASDADGDPLTYAWSAPAGRFVGATDGATARWTAPPETGRYRVGVRVSDGEGGSTEATASVTVALPNRPPAAVGTIPDQTLEAGGEAATVDLAAYFEDPDGEALAFRAISSDTAVVGSAVEGPALILTPVSAGSALVTVSAEDAAGQTAMHAFGVVVGRNRLERVVLEETLAAMARSQLASARMAVGRRVRRPRTAAGPDALVMGGAVPLGREEGWAGLRGAAEGWLSVLAPLRPGNGDGPGGRPMLPGSGPGAAGTPSPWETPVSWPELAEGIGTGGGSGALFRGTEFEVVWGGQEGASGSRWALWGEGDVQTFAGAASGATDDDGDVRTGYVGIDTELTDRWLLGAAVSRSRGGGDWRAGAGSGRLESTLTTAQPYARWSNGTTSIWMLAGGGRGELENLAGAADRSVSGLDLRLGLIELRQRVGSAAGAEVAIRADAGWAELASEEGEGSVDGLEAAVNQARIGADASRTMRVGTLLLEPFGEAHVRRDGGAGQTGSGLEVAGGLRAVAGAVRIDAQGRILAVHSAEGYRERGAGLSLAVGGRGAEGLSLAVSSRWGDTGAGTGVFWDNGGLHDRSLPGPEGGTWKFDARGRYGLRLGSRLLSWFGTVGRSTGESRLTIGGRFGSGNR
ncbi:MAG: spondin domain-containing protein [Gammaproteobacteria bacterium]|nr:spondin domain-containing protein [Gammaproteobacteria bacterium]MDE0246967.1 spondin domain-containing protein [Gammaproteobacteria bacterium]